MIVKDYMKNENTEIRLDAMNSHDECDAWRHSFWRGMLHDIPEKYQSLEVVDEGYMLEAQVNALGVYAPELSNAPDLI